LFVKSAQVFSAISQNYEKIFYSFFRKDLSAFWPVTKNGIFVKSAQVRANYRGTLRRQKAEVRKSE